MAVAKVYDEFEDVGLSFTEEEVRDWDPQAWAQDRVDRIVQLTLVARSRADQPIDKEEFWKWMASGLANVATWYCRALELPGLDREEDLSLGSLSPSERKKIRAEALRIGDGEGWILEGLSSGQAALGYVVTIGRRSFMSPVGRGSRGRVSKSRGNKLANAVMKEVTFFTKAEAKFNSLSS